MRQYIALHRACTSFIVAAIAACGPACADPDPHTVRGALDHAARALEARDGRALFRVLDHRARAALTSIVRARGEAARLITSDYPEPERSAALAALGDAVQAGDAADLFVRRCAIACLNELAAAVGAPVSETDAGAGDRLVRTVRGATLRLHRGLDGRWGLVWNTDALATERTRAARELIDVRHNAEVYRRRRELERSADR